MSKTAKRPVQLFAALALVLGTLVLTGGVAFADGSVDWTGQGTTNGSLNTTQCDAENTPYLLWVFTPGGGQNTVTAATLHLGGSGAGDFAMNQDKGQWKATTGFFDLATLEANVTFTGNLGSGNANLVISHGCPGNEAAIASITTEIHAGASDVGDPTPIPNESTIDLGSTVHDSATLTTDSDPLDLPDGSYVIFYFFDDQESCDALDTSKAIDTSAPDYDVSDESSPFTKDPGLDEGPLSAGDYGFIAQFISGDTGVVTHATSDCEPFTVDQSDSKTSTSVVREDTDPHEKVDLNGHLPLGTSVHDTATVEGNPTTPFDPTGTVTYHFYNSIDCTTGEYVTLNGNTWPQPVIITAGGVVPDSQSTGALAAGDYGFQAVYSGDSNYRGSTGDCEPFVIDKGVTTTVTKVLDANGNDVTGTTVPNGSVVHDSAVVSPAVAGFPITGTVTYYFSSTGCTGTFTLFDTVTIDPNTGNVPNSKDTAALNSGSYAFYAVYSGNGNYAESTGGCEPFTVRTFGKTMGFWGNQNGIARIIAAGGYAANPVNIGRGGDINTQAESLKVLPSTLNGCGKGNPIIFTGSGGATTSADCTSASGINKNSLNTLAAQTLALGYNIKLVSGYTGQTIGGMGCTPVGSLITSSTVNDAFAAAVALINGSVPGGATTQAQIGAMNTLLGCLNAEA
jgi:hypothetical protein